MAGQLITKGKKTIPASQYYYLSSVTMQSNKKVWIVDDDKSIRWVLEKALNSADVDITSFSHPDDVLERINKEEPVRSLLKIRTRNATNLESRVFQMLMIQGQLSLQCRMPHQSGNIKMSS